MSDDYVEGIKRNERRVSTLDMRKHPSNLCLLVPFLIEQKTPRVRVFHIH